MALSNSERQALFRVRQKERGMVQQVGWVSPDQDLAIRAILEGNSVGEVEVGINDAETIERLRSELHAAHTRTDYALALFEMLSESRIKGKRIDSDVLSRLLVNAAKLRGELDVILNLKRHA